MPFPPEITEKLFRLAMENPDSAARMVVFGIYHNEITEQADRAASILTSDPEKHKVLFEFFRVAVCCLLKLPRQLHTHDIEAAFFEKPHRLVGVYQHKGWRATSAFIRTATRHVALKWINATELGVYLGPASFPVQALLEAI